jgi:hypothetical protein
MICMILMRNPLVISTMSFTEFKLVKHMLRCAIECITAWPIHRHCDVVVCGKRAVECSSSRGKPQNVKMLYGPSARDA